MRFQDAHGGGCSFRSKAAVKKVGVDATSETPGVEFVSADTQTAIAADSWCQTEPIESSTGKVAVDDDRVKAFLNDVGGLMLREMQASAKSLAFDDFSVEEADADDADLTRLFTLSFDFFTHFKAPAESNGGRPSALQLQCTGVSWNATGSVLAVAYGRFDHSGWCDYRSALCLWNIFHPDFNVAKPSVVLETSSGLMCVAHHPTMPAVVAAGSFNGEVLVWNTALEETLVASSGIGDYFHREPIAKVSWIYDPVARDYNIASVSGDGKVLVWQLKDKLAYPVEGYLLGPKAKLKPSKGAPAPLFGGVALAFRTNDRTNRSFVVGSEAGSISRCFANKATKMTAKGELKWSNNALRIASMAPQPADLRRFVEAYAKDKKLRDVRVSAVFDAKPDLSALYPSALDFSFEAHGGPVYDMAFSPFHGSLFLSCSSDGSVRLYHYLQRDPLLVFQVGTSYLYAVAWSKTRPLVFAVASEDGNAYVYDLQVNRLSPVATLSLPEGKQRAAALYTVEFNPRQRNFVACGDGNGLAYVWKLSWRLSNLRPDERAVLDGIAELRSSNNST
ncbi:hypothetical protein SDRG_07640 [Saprolegnia diclina VS20]|uniref:Uncharacterized protein n=1 Tax=Saprolegnia diclina (strain VS20) TaxID=1156394 RepID=T0QJD8_SAPDV|nr:hypothetical protein SDRG_07640 [Saprolegnia diclina VS20]EQC34836.1 hypothetical protein SDRG_07640 [Saprolegnia diclina VS20]|eukprot:XP_008611708.1 hypothetical protein SDRG_07640 [Saprolegnia diclina VS20]